MEDNRILSRGISARQIEAVLRLGGPERYDHFVKQVVDWEVAWGLYSDGWAMGENDAGICTFPLWPAREYAEFCATGYWSDLTAEPITLNDLRGELLPKLRRDGILVSVFRTPSGNSVMPSIEQLLADLENELLRYE
jgi:hypothetical protein